MPELPEVETIVRDLQSKLAGERIVSIEVLGTRTIRQPLDSLVGQRIGRVHRHGKAILFACDREAVAVRLGMTGQLLIDADPGRHCQAVLAFDGFRLVYRDIRQFGRIVVAPQVEDLIVDLGPDALAVSLTDFRQRFHRHRCAIKPLLLNQSFLAGLGNIYVDEILHAAGIHPLTTVDSLSRARIGVLHERMQVILAEAIRCRGSSISDYVDASGHQGSYQLRHRVYAKQGKPCATCGAPIERLVVAQRGTHFCPRCQRA